MVLSCSAEYWVSVVFVRACCSVLSWVAALHACTHVWEDQLPAVASGCCISFKVALHTVHKWFVNAKGDRAVIDVCVMSLVLLCWPPTALVVHYVP
jgi:hypothetical protein